MPITKTNSYVGVTKEQGDAIVDEMTRKLGGTVTPDNIPFRNSYQEYGSYDKMIGTAQDDTGTDPIREGESPEQYKARILNAPFLYEDPNSATGYSTRNPSGGGRTFVPTMSQGESEATLKKYGLTGTGKDDLTGMTFPEAYKKAKGTKQARLGGAILDNVPQSYYEVTQLGNIKKTIDDLTANISRSNMDPWNVGEEKKNIAKNLVNSATFSIASQYTDPQKFLNDYQTNPNLQNIMQDYIRAGGSIADISNKIATNNPSPVTDQSADGQNYTDQNVQTADQYLLNTESAGLGDNVYTRSADAFLNPERTATVEEINRIAKVPEAYKEFYFGTDEKIGTFQKLKSSAEEAIKQLKVEIANKKQTASDMFDLQVRTNNEKGKIAIADLEEKRLKTKNYLTEKLASIGALTTTGKAPEALANIDVKYDQAKNTALNELESQNNLLMIKKTETINSLEDGMNEKILEAKSSIDKTEAEIEEEIFKIRQSTAKEVNSEINKFNTRARSVYKDFLDVSDKMAQTYIKNFISTATGGMSSKYLKEFNAGIASTKKATKPTGGAKTYSSGKMKYTNDDLGEISTFLENTRDATTRYVDPLSYVQAFNEWTNNGGLAKDFTAKFPPNKYVAPDAKNLPLLLRNTQKAPKGSDRSL